jgi:hypothetical protein
VEALELRRFLGLGRVVVDERGVTRRGLSTSSLAWDEIVDYRLTAVLLGVNRPVIYLSDVLEAIRIATTAIDAYRGRDRFGFGIAVFGATRRVRFSWRFPDAQLAIAMILNRLCRPLGRRARTAFERDGVGRFGPLTLADHGIEWLGKPGLPRARVEHIDLFDSSPVRLRVMARGKAFPYASVRLADIPHLVAALDLARALGYRVRGRELLAPVGV